MITLNIALNPKKIALSLAGIALCLAVFSIVGRIITDNSGSDETDLAYNLAQVFNVNRENSLPAWFSAGLLLACSATLAVIAAAKRAARAPYARPWAGLALIFLYLSADEGAGIHEKLTQPLQTAFNTTHHLYFAWVLAAIPLVIIFALAYLPFLLHLSRRVRTLVALAGVMYVGALSSSRPSAPVSGI